ncbi:pilus assembly protein PilM [Halobacillus sp. HZG1]|uniref:type IV pilus biogenesis protein PilM n=1 Tax=Halobacillus sp. HZG1 TaxID=3111769 RepID=UPI002DBFF6B3|nr:pilus assembly protein PilM [Halobacillus sp. HZG1]MEC3882646.1 pilus assembly protein PilM [Halobacillus sp. HZG1]
MFRFFNTSGRVNFVIKNHCIRYVYSKSGHAGEMDDMGEIVLPPHVMEDGKVKDVGELTRIVDNFVENKGWSKKTLYFTVPDHSVVVRPYDVPVHLKDDEIKGYLYMQLGETLHLPFDDPAFDYSVLGEKGEYKKLLLFSFPEEQIRMLDQVFNGAKLKTKAADISALSIYRLYEYLELTSEGEHLLLIDWNLDGCVLTVFNEHVPAFINHTRSPLTMTLWKRENGHYLWQGNDEGPTEFTYDQINEVERIMDFYRFSVMNGEASVSKVLLTGDWPENERVKDLLEEKGIQVAALKDADVFLESNQTSSAEYMDAIGLAIKP